MKQKEITPFKKPTCPECNSKEVRHLKKTDSYWCRRCGNTWKRESQPPSAEIGGLKGAKANRERRD